MTLAPLLLAQLKALKEDLSECQPFAMVALTEFGIVSGYAPRYESLRNDAIDTLDLCSRLFPTLQIKRRVIAAAAPNEHVNEGRLREELRQLLGAVAQATDGLQSLRGGREWEEAVGVGGDRRVVAGLLARSGIELKPRREDEPGKALPIAEMLGGEAQKIFVCNSFSRPLSMQIADGLASAGHKPVIPRHGSDEDALYSCSGGVFNLFPSVDRRATSPGGSKLFLQQSAALRRISPKLLLVGTRRMAVDVPHALSSAPQFKLKGDVMDDVEMERFTRITARPLWRLQSVA